MSTLPAPTWTREPPSVAQMSVAGRLFQARIWREYAQAWDGRRTSTGVGREWVEHILRVPRDECLRRARVNVYLARRANRLGPLAVPAPPEKE